MIEIETDRLILRPPIKSDFDDFARMQADESVKKYIGGVMTRPKAWASFCGWIGDWTIQNYSFFSVVEKSSGDWIGRCGPVNRDDFGLPELGWALFDKYQGKGYAFESAKASMDWAIKNLGWTEAILFISAVNLPSQKLATKLGFNQIEPIRHPFEFSAQDAQSWHITIEKWYNTHGQ